MLAKKVKQVLLELQKANLLPHLILIGSWCGVFYTQYFGEENYFPNIQTLDVDFLIPKPKDLKEPPLALPDLLKALDFSIEFSGSGWTRFVHPELRVEFLVPRLGPQSDDPQKIGALQINAMPLRHTHVLTAHTLIIQQEGFKLRVPHPLAFALHKLLISNRRKEKGKALRDQEMALRILDAYQRVRKMENIQTIWDDFTKKEKKEILEVVLSLQEIPLKPALIQSLLL